MVFKPGQSEEVRAKDRVRKKIERNKVRNTIFEHYGRKCNCCGENGSSFLTMDHVNNDGNKHKNSSGKRWTGVFLYRKIINSGFPDTYQVLCMNCNWSKHKNGGICEHQMD